MRTLRYDFTGVSDLLLGYNPGLAGSAVLGDNVGSLNQSDSNP